ncbi:MAG TPA: mycofactocin biosynthesis chaperone MftB [Solirubrobacterales bacterium]|nr:mycofactocin biosynthesis chaperone MftB [Solirubrobacterales bacterium]
MSAEIELSGRWRLHPQVALRPERFGALAYHFGNRRLSFLKSRRLLDVVQGLEAAPDPVSACRVAGVEEDQLPGYRRALATLAESGMIVPAERGAFPSHGDGKSPQEVAA